MIRRQTDASASYASMEMSIESPYSNTKIEIRCAPDKYKEIKKYMVDKSSSGSKLSLEWTRIDAALHSIFSDTDAENMKTAISDVAISIVENMIPGELKPHIYEVIAS